MTRFLGGMLALSLLWHWWTWTKLVAARQDVLRESVTVDRARQEGAQWRVSLVTCTDKLQKRAADVRVAQEDAIEQAGNFHYCRRLYEGASRATAEATRVKYVAERKAELR